MQILAENISLFGYIAQAHQFKIITNKVFNNFKRLAAKVGISEFWQSSKTIIEKTWLAIRLKDRKELLQVRVAFREAQKAAGNYIKPMIP